MTSDRAAVIAATLREVLDTFSPMKDTHDGPVAYYDGSADIEPEQYDRWRAVLDGALRRMADETATTETPTDPVQHAPGKVICCADCRTKGYAVCLDEPAETVHGCPPVGSDLTPCCGRTPFELPLTDRISSEAPTTCTGPAAGARQDGVQP